MQRSAPVLSHLCNENTQLGTLVRRQANANKDIIVTFCNFAFVDMALNWFAQRTTLSHDAQR
jgi:hypothetical protein